VIGYSDDSPILEMVAADKPNQPDAPTTWIEETNRNTIAVKWTAPIENVGSPTTHYLIWYKT